MLPAEIAVVKDRLNEMIDGAEIHTASGMPRKEDWIGPFQPIMKAAKHNKDTASRCFGIMVWEVFMERPEKWSFGRFEKDGEPIRGMTYFRVAN